MEAWSVHQLFDQAKADLGVARSAELREYAQHLIYSGLPVIFSLKHLSKIAQVDYRVLCDTVGRRRESVNYKMFPVKKRSGGRRFIHAVSGQLFSVQQFINTEILQNLAPHPSSFAFHRNGGIRKCAAMHCGARWLFQFDLSDFFYDVTEIDVFRIFQRLGYRKLLAFELARICTTTRLPAHLKCTFKVHRYFPEHHHPYGVTYDVGVLPQGAPTSPMLSNLAARELDERLFGFALANGFVYTRYADDITLSAIELPSRVSVGDIHRQITHIVRTCGFRENKKKTRVAGPGSRKIVLGLLVDGDQPRISRETYNRIDRRLYAAQKFGIAETASHEGFDSAYGFYNHLAGLISFVNDVDKKRWADFDKRLSEITLPWQMSPGIQCLEVTQQFDHIG